jgi:hypothetical protein
MRLPLTAHAREPLGRSALAAVLGAAAAGLLPWLARELVVYSTPECDFGFFAGSSCEEQSVRQGFAVWAGIICLALIVLAPSILGRLSRQRPGRLLLGGVAVQALAFVADAFAWLALGPGGSARNDALARAATGSVAFLLTGAAYAVPRGPRSEEQTTPFAGAGHGLRSRLHPLPSYGGSVLQGYLSIGVLGLAPLAVRAADVAASTPEERIANACTAPASSGTLRGGASGRLAKTASARWTPARGQSLSRGRSRVTPSRAERERTGLTSIPRSLDTGFLTRR